MKKSFILLFALTVVSIHSLTGQADIVVAPDSVYEEAYANYQIGLTSYITNYTGNPVTIRWTKVVEQAPQGWINAFCDKNLCYVSSVTTKTFELIDGEEGLLKPIFYPLEIAGTGVMRLYYISETPGVVWADTAVYVAVANELVGTVETELVRDIAVFPNPANELLNVVTSDANLRGQWRITDAAGKVWDSSNSNEEAIASQISIAHLPVGIYLLNVVTPNGRYAIAKPFTVLR